MESLNAGLLGRLVCLIGPFDVFFLVRVGLACLESSCRGREKK